MKNFFSIHFLIIFIVGLFFSILNAQGNAKEKTNFLLYNYLRTLQTQENFPNPLKKEQLRYVGCFVEDFSQAISLSLFHCRCVEDIEKPFLLKTLQLAQQGLKITAKSSFKSSLPFHSTLKTLNELNTLKLEDESVPLEGWFSLEKSQDNPPYGIFQGEMNVAEILVSGQSCQIQYQWTGEFDLDSDRLEYLEFQLSCTQGKGTSKNKIGYTEPRKPVEYLNQSPLTILGKGKLQYLTKDDPPSQAMIDDAIALGVRYMKRWLKENPKQYGAIALVLLACLKSNLVEVDQALFLENLDNLLKDHQYTETLIEYDTYTPGLIMMLGEAFIRASEGLPPSRLTPEISVRAKQMEEKMQKTLECLLATYETRMQEGKAGWGGPDLSNTQYGILGLHAAARYGLFSPTHPKFKVIWNHILTLVLENQCTSNKKINVANIFLQKKNAKAGESVVMAQVKVGGWPYQIKTYGSKKNLKNETNESAQVSHSMTCTGIASLAIAMQYLEKAKALKPVDQQVSQLAILQGLAWLQENYSIWNSYGIGTQHYYYYLYALERAGIIANFKYIGQRDWYREGAFALCVQQSSRGNWSSSTFGSGDEVHTAFAVLFLKRATTTVITTGSDK